MSGSFGQSPGSPFKLKNSPDAHKNARSPFVSPRNGNADFLGSSPMKNYGWRNNHRQNNPRFYFQNDHNKYYSPRGGRRGGHFRGGGSHRGSPRNNADISLYVNPSMLSDPWKDLSELLQPRLRKLTDEEAPVSAEATPNDSQCSINTSASNTEITEQVTEDSLIMSDTSGNISEQTVEECATAKC